MKQLTTNPDLNNMLEQLRDNAQNEHLFKVRMDPQGNLRVNDNQYICNERHFNEFRDAEQDGLTEQY